MSDKKLINIEANTPEELCEEFVRAMAAVGEISVQDSASGKPYGKLLVNVPFTPRGGSYVNEWPDGVSISGGKHAGHVPSSVTLTLILSGLQATSNKAATLKTQAATVKADLARMLAKAQRLGVDTSDVIGNAAGE
jgi:hypothetical protein